MDGRNQSKILEDIFQKEEIVKFLNFGKLLCKGLNVFRPNFSKFRFKFFWWRSLNKNNLVI